jgi:uncharacterized protein YecE (DUF72 family)
VTLRVGTSGYSYKEWKGSFYPEKIAASDMLRYYGERLSAVEINNTFYRMPTESVLRAWAEKVPEEFRFSIKASRKITHFRRLKEADDETAYLLRTSAALGDRLGVILFQLPPGFPEDLSRLESFLALLPAGTRAAFEFRHPSWHRPETFERLRAHDCALCVADTDDGADTPVVGTASWGYLRLRRASYDDGALAAWADRIRDESWSETFVFFKHEDEGAGPKLAARFLELAAS